MPIFRAGYLSFFSIDTRRGIEHKKQIPGKLFKKLFQIS